jgi:hypothetical protein
MASVAVCRNCDTNWQPSGHVAVRRRKSLKKPVSDRVSYHRGQTVHPIQARLAWEDHETWERVTVLRVHPPLIIVEDESGETRHYEGAGAGFVGQAANDGRTTAFVTERWGIIAVESGQGQVIRIPNAEHIEPGSIWVLSDADRLRFISVVRVAGEDASD